MPFTFMFPALVLVNDFNIDSVAAFKPEAQSPLLRATKRFDHAVKIVRQT
jgi:hypothetical protein